EEASGSVEIKVQQRACVLVQSSKTVARLAADLRESTCDIKRVAEHGHRFDGTFGIRVPSQSHPGLTIQGSQVISICSAHARERAADKNRVAHNSEVLRAAVSNLITRRWHALFEFKRGETIAQLA